MQGHTALQQGGQVSLSLEALPQLSSRVSDVRWELLAGQAAGLGVAAGCRGRAFHLNLSFLLVVSFLEV